MASNFNVDVMRRNRLIDLGLADLEDITVRLEKDIEEDPQDAPEEVTANGNFEREEVIEACRTQLNFLAALCMPDTFEYMFPPTHLTAWSILLSGEKDRENKFLHFAIGIPRGHAKTTLIKLFVVWCILFSKRKFILITASIELHAINIIKDIMSMLAQENMRAVFGDYRLGLETDIKTLQVFGFRGRKIIILGIGAGGAIRGANLDNARPDLIIMDDIQTKECADSQPVSKALEEWMFGTLMKTKSPNGCMFVFAGNMFAAYGSILKKLKTNPTWIKFISGAILADGTALWPELRSYEDLIEEFNTDLAAGLSHIFFSEVLNDTEAGINSTVDYSKFPQWPWTKDDLPQGKFLFIDPSQGKGMDNDVILTAEVYDEKIGIRAVHEECLSPANLIRKALIIAIKSEIYCIAIEAMAYQSTLLYWFEYICNEVGIQGIQFLPIYSNMHSKNSRIQSGIKAMQTHEIYLHADVRSMVQHQIANWNPVKRDNKDDILDAIAHSMTVKSTHTWEIMCRSNLLVIESGSARVVEDNHAF